MDSGIYNRKVCIIGAGHVGASITYALMLKELAHEIVLIDISRKKAEAEILDIRHGIPYMGSVNIRAGEYCDITDSDLIIITAGRNRRPGESRLDMASDNIKIAFGVTESIKKYYNGGVILVVSNPNDILTYKISQWMELPTDAVFGTGCILDESRFVNVIADYVGLNSEIISAQLIGEHGESQIALWSKVAIVGIPIRDYCKTAGLDFNSDIRINMEQRVIKMGSEIIEGKGRTHYGIATCVCYIADAILNRRATIVCVSSVLKGEYGIYDVALSLPCIIGNTGIIRRLEDTIDVFEMGRLVASSEILKDAMTSVELDI